MERAVEPETKKFEFEVVTEIEEETPITEPKQKAKRIYRAPGNTLLYAQSLSGFAVIVALLFVPLITLPGMLILVLIAEVYLLDWTYSKVSRIRETKSFISKETADRSPEDEIDRKVPRTGPKDQFVK
ncbi:MAG: hypothetical protein ACW98U_14340 [Candidatus Thorarchaeota archaeon]|jgi:hypothetical protein